jgi:hypothetical protein
MSLFQLARANCYMSQLFTCWKCPTLVDLTHCIKHELNPLLGSVETKKVTHLVYQLCMSSLLVIISKNYILSPFLDFHQHFFQELLFVARINGKSFIGRCKKKVVIIIPRKILARFDYKPRIKYKNL